MSFLSVPNMKMTHGNRTAVMQLRVLALEGPGFRVEGWGFQTEAKVYHTLIHHRFKGLRVAGLLSRLHIQPISSRSLVILLVKYVLQNKLYVNDFAYAHSHTYTYTCKTCSQKFCPMSRNKVILKRLLTLNPKAPNSQTLNPKPQSPELPNP